jgi:hypothetical protein
MFMSTFNGQVAQPVNPFGGMMMPAPPMNPPNLFGKKPRPNPAPAMYFGGGGAGGIIGNGRVPQITKIEKIFNCVIYDKFINEFKRMLKKYPQKTI